jgi:hypothetical protein
VSVSDKAGERHIIRLGGQLFRPVLIRHEPKSPRTSQRSARRRQPWASGKQLSNIIVFKGRLCCAASISQLDLPLLLLLLPHTHTLLQQQHNHPRTLHQHSESKSAVSFLSVLIQPARAASCPAHCTTSKKLPPPGTYQRCAGVGLDFCFSRTRRTIYRPTRPISVVHARVVSKVLPTLREIVRFSKTEGAGAAHPENPNPFPHLTHHLPSLRAVSTASLPSFLTARHLLSLSIPSSHPLSSPHQSTTSTSRLLSILLFCHCICLQFAPPQLSKPPLPHHTQCPQSQSSRPTARPSSTTTSPARP